MTLIPLYGTTTNRRNLNPANCRVFALINTCMLKNIIERKLDLTVCYNLIETKYIPLVESYGIGCDNCGKPIARIATIKAESTGKVYDIGFDCLDTILLNNQILRGEDLDNYNACKKSLTKIMKIKEEIQLCLIDNVKFIYPVTRIELHTDIKGWLSYYFYDANGKNRGNACTKIKDLHFPTLLATLQQIKGLTFELKT